jgi:hypothetical protein
VRCSQHVTFLITHTTHRIPPLALRLGSSILLPSFPSPPCVLPPKIVALFLFAGGALDQNVSSAISKLKNPLPRPLYRPRLPCPGCVLLVLLRTKGCNGVWLVSIRDVIALSVIVQKCQLLVLHLYFTIRRDLGRYCLTLVESVMDLTWKVGVDVELKRPHVRFD